MDSADDDLLGMRNAEGVYVSVFARWWLLLVEEIDGCWVLEGSG
jgi:hypothetical protein